MTSLYDVVALGDCDVDVFARVEHLPTWGEKVPADLLAIEGGGVAANFSCATARLGLRTALLSSVGDDEFGALALESLRHFGVDVGGVAVRQGASTYFSFVCLDDRGEKALTIVRTPTFFPSSDDLDEDRLRNTRLLHIAPFDLSVAAEAARQARAAGAAVSVDLEPAMVQQSLEEATELLESTDILFVNEFTVAKLFIAGRFADAAAALLEKGPWLIVVTRGAEGAYARVVDREVHISAYRIDPEDTTGAGDAFNASFLAWWLDGHSLTESLAAGTAAAAMAITTVGARAGLPTRDEIRSFIDQNERPLVESRLLPTRNRR